MAKSTKLRDFTTNSIIIIGCLSTLAGFCLASTAIYELHSEKKIAPIVNKLHLPTITKAAETLDEMSFLKKSRLIAPLLIFGSSIMLVGRRKVDKAQKYNT